MEPNEGSANERSPVLDEVQAWCKQGEELRAKLAEERGALLQRLKEVDDALAMVSPSSVEPSSKGPWGTRAESGAEVAPEPIVERVAKRAAVHDATASFSPRSLKGLSMPVMVRRIVQAHPDGIAAPSVLALVREVQPKVDAALVHSALYRTGKAGDIRSEGSRGTRTYFPTAAQEDGEED